jgi:hypothetical protein
MHVISGLPKNQSTCAPRIYIEDPPVSCIENGSEHRQRHKSKVGYLTKPSPNEITVGTGSPSGGTMLYAESTVAAKSRPVRSAMYRPGQILGVDSV